ncbi:MAG: hypothetical protein ABWY55_04980 [Microbacterium sp.]
MDAATRAELAALRRRAYAADADIATDATALRRLDALEELARLEHAPAGDQGDPVLRDAVAGVAAAVESAPVSTTIVEERPTRPTTAPPRALTRRHHLALVAATGAIAVLLALTAWVGRPTPAPAITAPALAAEARDALAFAADPEVRVLVDLRLDGSFGGYVTVPSSGVTPQFPIPEPRWTWALGDYYGFELWIAGTVGSASETTEEQELCLVLVGEATSRSRCAGRSAWEQGALLLSVEFAGLDDDERPAGMTADQSLGFWWTDDDRIRMLLGRAG